MMEEDVSFDDEPDEEPKSEKQQLEAYEKNLLQVSKYIEIGGMFEIRNGMDYTMFNGLNKNSFDWKAYN